MRRFVLGCFVLASSFVFAAASAADELMRPNILLIVADDK